MPAERQNSDTLVDWNGCNMHRDYPKIVAKSGQRNGKTCTFNELMPLELDSNPIRSQTNDDRSRDSEIEMDPQKQKAWL